MNAWNAVSSDVSSEVPCQSLLPARDSYRLLVWQHKKHHIAGPANQRLVSSQGCGLACCRINGPLLFFHSLMTQPNCSVIGYFNLWSRIVLNHWSLISSKQQLSSDLPESKVLPRILLQTLDGSSAMRHDWVGRPGSGFKVIKTWNIRVPGSDKNESVDRHENISKRVWSMISQPRPSATISWVLPHSVFLLEPFGPKI